MQNVTKRFNANLNTGNEMDTSFYTTYS